MKRINVFILVMLSLLIFSIINDFWIQFYFYPRPEIFLIGLELLLISRAIITIYLIRKEFRNQDEIFIVDEFDNALKAVFGNNKIVNFIISEITITYFAIFGFFKKPKNDGENMFTYLKKSNYRIIIVILIFLSLVEIPLIHLLLSRINETIAWIVTILSIYSFIWIIGDYQMMKFHPILVNSDQVRFRIGQRWKFDLLTSNIEKVEVGKFSKDDLVKVTPDNRVNLKITLNEKTEIFGLFGIPKFVCHIGLYLDKPEDFYYLLSSKLKQVIEDKLA